MSSTLRRADVLDDDLKAVFGADDDPIELVDARAQARFGTVETIVWEGDPQTFQFSFISARATALLGWPRTRWTSEPTFWADCVVHDADRSEAVAFCALATGRGADHVFEYRARTADGRVLWLRDVVRVIQGPRKLPVRLRGVMFDVSAARAQALPIDVSQTQRPTRDELLAMPRVA